MGAFNTSLDGCLAAISANLLAAQSDLRAVYTDPSDFVGGTIPCAILSVEGALRHDRRPQWRQVAVPVRIQILITRFDLERAHTLARGWLGDFMERFDLDLTLGGFAARTDWEEGGFFAIGQSEWNGEQYISLQATLRVWIHQGVQFTA